MRFDAKRGQKLNTMNTPEKKYKIVENVDDFVGYHGQPLTIIKTYRDNYIDVTDGQTIWTCGEEELQEITQ